MLLTKTVLTTDGSPEAGQATEMAVTLSDESDSKPHVVHVGQVPSAYAASESEILDYNFREEIREHASREAAERLEEIILKIEDGGTEEIGAGMMVVGSRGYGPRRRALMGSVSDSVVRHAHCPVLVVRANRREERFVQRSSELEASSG